MAPFKVLIVGGGITGPAVGYWLSKIRCNVTILERSLDLRASGQQVDLRGQGLTCMRRMGIEAAVREKLVVEHGLRFIDQNGKTKAFFESNKTGQGKQGFSAEFEIMRGDLVRILYDITKDQCQYRFGLTIDRFEQLGDRVRVKFSDGQEEDYDLLIGADGQGSRTRKELLGPNSSDPFNFLNLYMSYFTVPKTEMDESYATVLILPRRRNVLTRIGNDPNTMQVYLGVMDPKSELRDLEEAIKAGDLQKQKEIYLDIYKDAGWQVPRFLDGLNRAPEAKDFYSQKIGQVKIQSSWSKGRVVLVGDAAYCPSPITGVGTSLGLIGAYVLSGEIAKQLKLHTEDSSSHEYGQAIDTAFESFERIVRPFVEKCQKLPPGAPGFLYAEGEWGVWWRTFLAGLISTLKLHKIAEKFGSDEFGGGWKLPDYPELEDD